MEIGATQLLPSPGLAECGRRPHPITMVLREFIGEPPQ